MRLSFTEIFTAEAVKENLIRKQIIYGKIWQIFDVQSKHLACKFEM